MPIPALRIGALAAISSVLATLPSCLFMPREAGERMQAELGALRGEVVRLRQAQEQADLRAEEDRTHEQAALQALRANVDTWSQSARRTDADMGTQMEQMLADVQQLRGAIELNEHRLTETEARLQQELATRLAQLKQATVKEERDSASAAVKHAAPKNKAELLPYALKLIRSGKKADGRGVLRDIVRRYGRDKGLTDEALFALASLAYDERQFDAALRDFVRLVDGFSKSPRAAEAYFKIGACSEALGRLDDARTFYAEVQTSYAQTPWAQRARARLAILANQSSSKKTAGKAATPASQVPAASAVRAPPPPPLPEPAAAPVNPSESGAVEPAR